MSRETRKPSNHPPEELYFVDLSEGLDRLMELMDLAATPVTMHRAGGQCLWVRAGGDPERIKNWARFEDPELAHAPEGVARVPRRVLTWPAISAVAKSIYTLLLSYAQESTKHRPGTLQLSFEAGCKGHEFWAYVDELARSGLVRLEDRGLGREPMIVFRRIPGYLWSGAASRGRR